MDNGLLPDVCMTNNDVGYFGVTLYIVPILYFYVSFKLRHICFPVMELHLLIIVNLYTVVLFLIDLGILWWVLHVKQEAFTLSRSPNLISNWDICNIPI